MNNNHNWLIPIFAPMEHQGLTRPQLATMTVAAGICVANIYYNQPLLKDMARDLQVSERQIGLIPVLTQTGYAPGLFFLTWTTLTFHLGGPPFNYATDIIGLFGLLAIGGALLAPVLGKQADKRHPARSLVMTIGLILGGVQLVMAFPNNLWATMAAVLLLDIGVQATQVSNVATIYSLDAAAHSRINTVYMTAYFLGGSIGNFVGVQCWHAGGWHLVTWQLLLWGVIALGLALYQWRKVVILTP